MYPNTVGVSQYLRTKGRKLQRAESYAKDLAVDWSNGKAVTAGWDAQLIVWNLEKRTPTQCHECSLMNGLMCQAPL